jgi:hypothetical protein
MILRRAYVATHVVSLKKIATSPTKDGSDADVQGVPQNLHQSIQSSGILVLGGRLGREHGTAGDGIPSNLL